MSIETDLDYTIYLESYFVKQTYCEARNHTSRAHEHWSSPFQKEEAFFRKRDKLRISYLNDTELSISHSLIHYRDSVGKTIREWGISHASKTKT